MPTKLEARVDKHDREIAAIRKLVLTGMKMLVRLEASQLRLEAAQEETDKMIRNLKASQMETDRMLKNLISSLGRGGNGNKKTDIR
jgi:peptidoglycan hydrolase CwlO-like protein